MVLPCSQSSLHLDPEIFRSSFDCEPFGFTHDLSELDLFKHDSLRNLAEKYATSPDYYVAGSAASPRSKFYSVPRHGLLPHEALDRLESVDCRILLKRLEQHDPQFRALLDMLFRQVVDLRGGLGRERVVRLESAVLISSAATITPFHFDPEINFFSQIEGEKFYHVYSPSSVTEMELERFYIDGRLQIGQVELQGATPRTSTRSFSARARVSISRRTRPTGSRHARHDRFPIRSFLKPPPRVLRGACGLSTITHANSGSILLLRERLPRSTGSRPAPCDRLSSSANAQRKCMARFASTANGFEVDNSSGTIDKAV